MSLYDWVRTVFLFGGWLGSLVFVVYYHFTSRWYRHPLSRYLMAGPLGLLSLYSAAVANALITEEWVRDALRMMMIVNSFLFAWYSVFVYHKMRKDTKRREEDNEG